MKKDTDALPIEPKCNHLGFAHELCTECGSIIRCVGCGDHIKYDFWNTAFEDKIKLLIAHEAILRTKEASLILREDKIKAFTQSLSNQ